MINGGIPFLNIFGWRKFKEHISETAIYIFQLLICLEISIYQCLFGCCFPFRAREIIKKKHQWTCHLFSATNIYCTVFYRVSSFIIILSLWRNNFLPTSIFKKKTPHVPFTSHFKSNKHFHPRSRRIAGMKANMIFKLNVASTPSNLTVFFSFVVSWDVLASLGH